MQQLIKLKYLCILLFLLFANSGVFASESQNTEYEKPGDGTLTDSNIQYIGRWDRNSTDFYQSHWLGAYIRVDFTGTSIKIKMEGNSKAWLIVQVDGETPRTIYAGDGTELSVGNLKNKRHTIMVGPSELINNKISFKGFILDAGGVTYKSVSKLLIEFIGDSITAGGGTFPKDIYNYAWLVSDRLDCDHTQIAYPGLALCTSYTYYNGAIRNTDQAVGMDKLYFSMKDLPHFKNDNYTITKPWDFATYTPDVVLMFLGTNDSSNGALGATDASPLLFKEKTGELFTKIREKYPDSHLLCMLPFSGVYKNEISTKIKELRNTGDKKVHFINTTGWLSNPTDFTDGIHLNTLGTSKVVDKLYNVLNPIIQSIKDGTEYEDPDDSEISEKFYLVPSSDWASHDATFGAIFKNETSEEKAMFSLDSALGMYELSIPDGIWTKICMKRYASDGVSDWGGFATFDPITETHINNFIPYNKTFNCVEVIGWADGTNSAQYSLSLHSADKLEGITIHFKKPESWSNINIHAWDAVGVALPGFEWPGNAMIEDTNATGWYYYTFDSSIKKVSFQFNKGDAEGLIVKEHVTESTSYDTDGSVASLKSFQDEDLEIRVQKNQINIYSKETTNVQLYSITGNLIHEQNTTGDYFVGVESGIYLLRVNENVYKILIP